VRNLALNSSSSPWQLRRFDVATKLLRILDNPDLVYQDGFGCCGEAAFLRAWLLRDPLAVLQFATTLFETGQSHINQYPVTADPKLLQSDYIQRNLNAPITSAVWMICGALADAEDDFVAKFGGDPSEKISLGTMASEVAATAVGRKQIDALMEDETLPFHEALCVHVADSTYSAVLFLGPTEKHKNLVNVVRSRGNRVFYRQPLLVEGKRKPGHPLWYGEHFSLKDPTTWGEPDAVEETTMTTRKGHSYRVQLKGWHDSQMRSKKDLPMHQKAFTLIRVQVLDEQECPVFKHTLWLVVMGQRRKELSLVEAWEAYCQRFDVEHFFRFGKQRLLMADFQTPDVDREENWLQFASLAYVQLWLARELVEALPRPWEQYLPLSESQVATPSAVQRDFGRILREIGTP
jgi:hypothetical protein